MTKSFLSPKSVPDFIASTLQHQRQGGDVAVYGAGAAASDVLKILKLKGIRPSFVLDYKSTKTEVIGLPVRRPDDSGIAPAQRLKTRVFMGIFNPAVNTSALIRELQAQNWKDIGDFVDLHALLPDSFGDRYWLTDRNFYGPFKTQIERVLNYWADDQSARLYQDTLRFRLSGDDSGLNEPDISNQYFPLDLGPLQMVVRNQALRIIDCGAFVGDTLRHIRKHQYPIDSIAFFEPDPLNYQKLCQVVAAGPLPSGGATLLPCGVSSRFDVLRFTSSQGAASAISETGDLSITCLSIDEALPNFRPTFIKMDVEGAEMAALQGALKTITDHHPILAISAYHRPQDLWEIPQALKDWGLDYNLYLRQHLFRGFDLVLYAVPNH
jgi:FkbM family methyltransferase